MMAGVNWDKKEKRIISLLGCGFSLIACLICYILFVIADIRFGYRAQWPFGEAIGTPLSWPDYFDKHWPIGLVKYWPKFLLTYLSPFAAHLIAFRIRWVIAITIVGLSVSILLHLIKLGSVWDILIDHKGGGNIVPLFFHVFVTLMIGAASIFYLVFIALRKIISTIRTPKSHNGVIRTRTLSARSFLLGLVAIVTLYLGWQWQHNPLPSDEEMIAHFEAHRAEFEELVRRYRAFIPFHERTPPKECVQPPCGWSSDPDTQALMKKAGVKRIGRTGFDGALWLPDPYEMQTQQRIHHLIKNPPKDYDLWYRYASVVVRYAKAPSPGFFSIRYLSISKAYFHVPEEPRIVDGELWRPITVTGRIPKFRVFDSLNDYPPDWQRAECVYRQIEAHWFLRMCRRAI